MLKIYETPLMMLEPDSRIGHNTSEGHNSLLDHGLNFKGGETGGIRSITNIQLSVDVYVCVDPLFHDD